MQLLLIRHGQAGATPDNYDELSALGRRQAQRMGQWLAAHDKSFAAAFSGTMRRQRDTLAEICALVPSTQRQELPGLNEYVFADLVRAYAADFPDDPDLRHVMADRHDKRRWFALLKTTLTAWSEDRIAAPPESYAAFCARIAAAQETLLQALGEGPVLAVSSGGVMSHLVAAALGASAAAAIDLNLTIANTGLCEMRAARNRLKVVSVNSLPHLSAPADAALITLA
jgi:broad specificity phosphatase PhoE